MRRITIVVVAVMILTALNDAQARRFLLRRRSKARVTRFATVTNEGAKSKEASSKLASYPYSEIVKVYEIALDAMTDKYFSKVPDLDKEHTAKLKSFIRSEYSSKKFVHLIVKDKVVAVFDRAIKDEAYRDTKEFEFAFRVSVNVSVPMARMIISGMQDVYVSKYIDKDPLKTRLFEFATDKQRLYVSWVDGEVTLDDFRKGVGKIEIKNKIKKEDRFYGFSSPPSTWENLTGRQGFIHVRDKKIIEVIVTLLN